MTSGRGLKSAWFRSRGLGSTPDSLFINDRKNLAGPTAWNEFFFGAQYSLSVSAVTYALTVESIVPNTGMALGSVTFAHTAESVTFALAGNAYALSLAVVTYAHAVGAATFPAKASQGAGRSRRYRHIYRVQIDGRPFECRSLAEALDLLAKARKFAEQHALALAKRSAGRDRPKPPEVRPPRIEAPRELKKAARETQDAIEKIYESARRDAEIAAWFEYAERAEEEDISMLMLM